MAERVRTGDGCRVVVGRYVGTVCVMSWTCRVECVQLCEEANVWNWVGK